VLRAQERCPFSAIGTAKSASRLPLVDCSLTCGLQGCAGELTTTAAAVYKVGVEGLREELLRARVLFKPFSSMRDVERWRIEPRRQGHLSVERARLTQVSVVVDKMADYD
jgi:hypothetical protein